MSSPAEVVVPDEGASGLDPAGALAATLRAEHGARITGELVVPAKDGRYAPLPAGLDARLVAALAGRGIDRLYTHQSSAWESVQAGRHSVVVTPTASGKTLCYNLPVLQAALTEQAKALYMFPTKALSQDQVAELTALNQAGSLWVCALLPLTAIRRAMRARRCAPAAISWSPIRTCCTRAFCRITPSGRSSSRACVLW